MWVMWASSVRDEAAARSSAWVRAKVAAKSRLAAIVLWKARTLESW